jgi:phage tail-like protein
LERGEGVEMDETSTTSRRRFLGTAAGATGVALGAAVWGSGQAAAAILPQGEGQVLGAEKRGFVSGTFALRLDGTDAGWLKDTEGGSAVADVIEVKQGTQTFAQKHIGQPKYEDITVQAGFSMSKAFYDWIAASWKMNFARKDGSVVAADFNREAMQERQFYNALITETGIPACDGSSKEPGYLALKFGPEFTRTMKANGKVSGLNSTTQKLWLPSNFKLEIDGLDCTRVNKIDAFTIKQTVVTSVIGDGRDFQKEPTAVEFPNLKITFASTSGASWMKWYDDFVIKGNSSDSDEKNGRLLFLTPNLQSALAEIRFFNMGIFALFDGVFDPVDEPSARMRAELYVERMEFNYLGGVPIPPAPSPTPTPAP